MPNSNRSEPKLSQFRATEVRARKPSFSLLLRDIPTSMPTSRSSMKSERRTRDLLRRERKRPRNEATIFQLFLRIPGQQTFLLVVVFG
jgi:hypothetical protein